LLKKLAFETEIFTVKEKKTLFNLSLVIGFRMLGLSMLIPVFSTYAIGLQKSSGFLVGLAFGVYGLTQALFQIPFGHLSDKFGRRLVVALGLTLFGIGSAICAITDDIYILIIGRFIQGSGAITSACFAWVADVTTESHRNRAMAFMGIAIGGGIVFGMILGPSLGGTWGVGFLFWLTTLFSMVGLFIILFLMEENTEGYVKDTSFTTDSSHLLKVIFEPEFMRLNVTGFIVNMSMIATFFTVPLRLAKSFSMSDLWIIYLPLSVIGAIAMMYSSRRADLGNGRTMLILALSVLSSAFLMLFVGTTLLTTLGGFALFFGAFSVLEAILPATVSKLSHPEKRGVTIGVYNLFQFSGTFFGGIVAGWLYAYSENAIFSIMMALTFISVALIATSKKHRVEIANRNNSK